MCVWGMWLWLCVCDAVWLWDVGVGCVMWCGCGVCDVVRLWDVVVGYVMWCGCGVWACGRVTSYPSPKYVGKSSTSLLAMYPLPAPKGPQRMSMG